MRSTSPPQWFPELSRRRTLAFSLAASSFVLLVSLFLQWLVYDDWLHETGPFHIVGTGLAALLTFWFVYRWEKASQARYRAALARFEAIARMNDSIRNALQVIECTAYAAAPHATEPIREAVDAIDGELRAIVERSPVLLRQSPQPAARARPASSGPKSA